MTGLPPRAAPLVTCIIIFLDEEDYLAEAIESVRAQTLKSWELLLVDDGSSDRSAEIAARYVAMEPDRIQYLQHDGGANRGMSASRNLGIAHARGEYLAFLDGDDCWFPDKLAVQIQLFRDHPEAELVCGASLYWHSWDATAAAQDRVIQTGELVKTEYRGPTLEQDRLYCAGKLVYFLYPLGKGATPSASGYMIKRSLAERLGGFEDSFRGLFEDQVFRAKAFLAAKVFVSSQTFDRYRQHAASEVHTAGSGNKLALARKRFFKWYGEYAQKHYPDDTRLRNRIDRTERYYFGWRAKARKIRQWLGRRFKKSKIE